MFYQLSQLKNKRRFIRRFLIVYGVICVTFQMMVMVLRNVWENKLKSNTYYHNCDNYANVGLYIYLPDAIDDY